MTDIDKAKILMTRLFNICNARGWEPIELWSNGLEIIKRNCNVVVWLERFHPTQMELMIAEGEQPTAEITIEVVEEWVPK